MKKLIVLLILIAAGLYVYFGGCSDSSVDEDQNDSKTNLLTSTEDIGLHDVDGAGANYAFTYNGEEFGTYYWNDCWTIYDSYKITNEDDMEIICQALIDVHPIHGKDMVSYRTPEDMAYEWEQHNLAYKYLPDDSPWLQSAANVDLDPYDQGRSYEEIYEDRTGEEFDLKEKIKESIEDGTIFEKAKKFLFN